MSLRWIPRFRYSDAATVVVELSIPMRPWRRSQVVVGKGRKVSSGARESFALRRDRLRTFRIRATEAEYQQMESAIGWAQENWGAPFEIDLGDGVWHSVYLEAPRPGEPLADEPSTVNGQVEFSLTLQKADGSAWAEVFF